MRRDRRRHSRPQPHDGEQPPRVLRLRPARGQGRCRESESMSTVITDLEGVVEDAAAHLYVWALKDIPQDLRDALADAATRETSVPGQRVLQTILKNVNVAETEKNLVCQDTGIAVYTCRVGEHFPLHPARIYAALKTGTERATVEHPLRSNAVHTITRENTGPNTGYRLPIVHWEFIPDWDGLDVKCVPKGSGSENMSFLKMCVPADGVKGIKQFVLESIVGAGGKPCPPGIVGVGIGGSADYAMYLAKEAIARPVGTRNPDPIVAQLEDELFALLNETGIGPMGLGGDVTVLQCHIEHADTHMTLNPVAVNYQCWAARRASAQRAASTTTGSSDERSPRRNSHAPGPGPWAGARRTCLGTWSRDSARGHVPGHRPAGDPQAARRRRGHRAGAHHRHPRPHADPHLRPGRRAADGSARRLPAAHRAGRAQARPRQVREGLHRHHHERAHGALHRAARRAIRRPCDLRQGRLPRRRDRADAQVRDGLFRDRRRCRRARDHADRGDRGGRVGGADAGVPVEVPRQGLRPADRRHRRARELALPRRAGRSEETTGGNHCQALTTAS